MATKKLPQKKVEVIADTSDIPDVKLDDELQIDSVDESQENDLKEEKKQKRIYYFGIFTSILIIFLSVLVVYLDKNIKKVSDPIVVEPVASTTVETSIKTMPSLSIEVLNASGVSGIAKKNADLLEKNNFKVVDTGNETKDTTGYELYIESDLIEFSDNILNDLKEVFPKLKYVSTFNSTNDSNVRIIIGK